MHLTRVAASGLGPVDINDIALNTTVYYTSDLSNIALDFGLSSALFGVLTLLVIIAVIFLSRKGLDSRPVKILLSSTLLLYGSTAVYMTSLASHVASVNRLVTQAQSGFLSDTFTAVEVASYEADVLKQSWMMTVAIGVNVVIGDSIVWWRVCAVWQNRVVNCVGPILIVLATAFGLRAMFGIHVCVHPCRQPQMLLQDGFFWHACAVLTAIVNILATTLIGYKAWLHRQMLHRYLSHRRRKSRVMNSLAMLVESGMIYFLLLVVVFIAKINSVLVIAPGVHQNAFLRIITHYTYSCFIPAIAIYPVLIIVIVALNRSPIEHGLSDGGGSPGGTTNEGSRHQSPLTLPDLNFSAEMRSTIDMTVDTTQPVCLQNDEGDVTDTNTKQDTVAVTV